jgi:predicted membrane chloride channel (bestrophin family)
MTAFKAFLRTNVSTGRLLTLDDSRRETDHHNRKRWLLDRLLMGRGVVRRRAWCFAALLPLCLIREFDRRNEGVTGLLAGQMAWLTVPFSALVAWMYVSLDLVGESTESPFRGANDVPISQISRLMEIELREMRGENDLPAPLRLKNDIVL